MRSRGYLCSRLCIYLFNQTYNPYFNIQLFSQLINRIEKLNTFVACGVEVAASGVVFDEPNGRTGRYLCRCNDSDVDGSRLARFYGGRFDSPSGERTERFR